MAGVAGRARSIIEVAILADVKNLDKTLTQIDKKIGTIGKVGAGVVGGFVALGAIDKGFEFVSSSLEKADAFSDAFDTLSRQITPEFADRVKDIAFDFSDIGLSADEVGALAANFANLATAAGASAPAIADMTPKLLDVAAAIAAKTGKTVDEVVTDLGKAAQGSQKPVADLGIVVDDTLNPDALLLSILEQAETLYGTAGDAAADYAGKQEALNAKWDNFSIKVGAALEGPLSGMLDFFITIIDRDIPRMMEGFEDLGKGIEDFARFALGPLGNLRDALGGILDLLGNVGNAIGGGGGDFFDSDFERRVNNALQRNRARNGDIG